MKKARARRDAKRSKHCVGEQEERGGLAGGCGTPWLTMENEQNRRPDMVNLPG